MKITVEFDMHLPPLAEGIDKDTVAERFLGYLSECGAIEPEGPGYPSDFWATAGRLVPEGMNDIFNQLMELFEEVEANLIDHGDAPMAEAFRQKISQIVEPLDDQLIDWRIDPDPAPEETDIIGAITAGAFALADDPSLSVEDVVKGLTAPEHELYDDEREPCADDLLRD